MNGHWIDLTAGDSSRFQGYLSLPPTGKGPGILLIQEIFGVNHHIRTVADQYALDGYTVLVPDLFWRQQPHYECGYSPEDMQHGMAMAQKMDLPQAIGDLIAAVDLLRKRPEVIGKAASVGYCLGGLLSYLVATRGAVDAAVCYYPGRIQSQIELAETVRCPIQFHFAGQDHNIPLTVVDAVEAAFAGRDDATVFRYPRADHGFNCWARAAYHQPSAALAHGRSLQFLAAVD